MTMLRTLVNGSIGAFAFIATVHAADAPGAWPAPPEFSRPTQRAVEMLSGWYLRGDIGYRSNRVNSVEAPIEIASQAYGKSASVGFGAGYKYQWLRGDMTFDYGTRANYSGTTAAATAQPQYVSRIDSFLMLANVYIDMGTWAGFTPYVGGGVGASYLRSTSYADTTLPAGELVPMGAKLNPSWAAMAGVSFQVLPTWVLDVGYRYVNLGDVQSGVDSHNNSTAWRKLSAQEIRVGFRMLLD